MTILDDANRIRPEALVELKANADMIACECPTYLVDILTRVREFATYSQGCITTYPEDQDTHKWLLSTALNLDTLLSSTIAQLARFEGFIDENNKLVSRGNTAK